jgi:bifunctional DNase/RNase
MSPAVAGGSDASAEMAARWASFSVFRVLEVHVELPSTYPEVRLHEEDPPHRRLVIPIGLPEGVALSQAMGRVPTARPLTHELFSGVLQRLGADIVAVRIVGRTHAIYLAELDLMGPKGREVIGCRPSDALILALRQAVPAPILVDERLLTGDEDVVPS